jgi:ferritin-like metal-binding protein YciE
MTLDTLDDLLVQQLRDLYSAERQIVRTLPKLVKAAQNEALAEAFESHLKQTEQHVTRLTECFRLLDATARGPKCQAMAGLLEEGGEMLRMSGDPGVRDAGIIADAQRVEHYEISAYGTAIALARLLGHGDVVQHLEATIAEERGADERLTEIAQQQLYPSLPTAGGTQREAAA